ncbi:T9SS type A sorting domain-containing protein [Nonlabens sp. Asnod2-A12]|uniref:DUF7619 domain-containing protein n=1 Tax=Nonlabens sp. Asnod2-A12 TaxID=3160578 RepID=UPI00386E6800
MKNFTLLSILLMLVSMQFTSAQDISFTDPDLENYLLNCYCMRNLNGNGLGSIDINNDSSIQISEAQNVGKMYVTGMSIDDLSGIEFFSNLTELEMEDTSVTYINASILPSSLQKLELNDNLISQINIANHNSLQYFSMNCTGTNCPNINSLDLINLNMLISLAVSHDNIASYNISGLPALKNFNVRGYPNSSLNLTSVNLENLSVRDASNLNQLNTNSFSVLEFISLNNVPINNLDLSSNLTLERISFTDMTLSNLDVSNNALLNYLQLTNFNTNNLDLSNNASLEDIQIRDGSISNLITPSFTNLTNLILQDINIPLSNFNSSFSTLNQLGYLHNGISSFDISGFTALRYLDLSGNNLTQLNGSNSNIISVNLTWNPLTNFDSSNLVGLESLTVYQVPITSLDVSNSPNFRSLGCSNSLLTELDFSNNPLFSSLTASNVPLEILNLKNGSPNYNHTNTGIKVTNHPSPAQFRYLCVDDDEIENMNILDFTFPNLEINSYCSFTTGGISHEVSGFSTIDLNNNGCTTSDPIFSNLVYTVSDALNSGLFSSNTDGFYSLSVLDGQHTISPNPENPTYWNFSPSSVVVDFPTQTSPFTQDFCVTANGSIEDLEVIVVPLEQARPGFDTDYKVVVKNKGNVTTSGTVTLDFEEDFMNLLSSTPTAATPATNQLSWSVSNLQPFQMEEYEFTMTLNTPTQTTNPLNGNDILTFTGVVTGTGTDAMPADNTMVFDQTVVNSYDPNDKTCLEGKTIDPADVGEYVHYMIRFENTGTASAVNIVVKDEIDLSQFDITTLIPLGGSHDYYTRVRDNNVVEFIHEDINLDFNDATNDGYVLFKIKTLNTLVAGDTFDNTADIFFDFNAPIVTNTEVVTIMTPLSISETTDTSIKVYPNPATSFMNLTAANRLESFAIVDINGRMLSQNNFTGNGTEQRISLENLSAGIYFVTIQSEVGQKVEKLIVK